MNRLLLLLLVLPAPARAATILWGQIFDGWAQSLAGYSDTARWPDSFPLVTHVENGARSADCSIWANRMLAASEGAGSIGWGSLGRYFKVVGSGEVTLSLAWNSTANGHVAMWLDDGSQYQFTDTGPGSGVFAWSGHISEGYHTGHFEIASVWDGASIEATLVGAPEEAQPVPEPASLLLLGLGLAGAATAKVASDRKSRHR